MRNRGRNYSRKNDRISPGYSVRTKSGSWKTYYRYGKYKFISTYAFPTEIIVVSALVLILVWIIGTVLGIFS